MVKTSPSNAGDESSIPDWGAKIPYSSRPKNQNIGQKQYCNKFSEDFLLKSGPQNKFLKNYNIEEKNYTSYTESLYNFISKEH